jgi:hypothetical protein
MPGLERSAQELEAELAEVDAAIGSRAAGGLEAGGEGPDPAEVAAAEEAGRKGWVPKEKFKGPPEKWKPASQFLADGEKFSKNLQRELDDLKSKYSKLEATSRNFVKYHEEVLATKQADLDRAIKDLRVAKSEATAQGDHTLSVEIEDRIELLKEEKKGLQEEAAPAAAKPKNQALKDNGEANLENPIINEWVLDGNEWFETNAALRKHAVELGQHMVEVEGETLRGKAFLDKVAARMREEFPRQFAKMEKKPAPRTQQVESGELSGAGEVAGRYSIHDLPEADLQLMKEFIAAGMTTKEKFLANYFQQGKRTHRTKSK